MDCAKVTTQGWVAGGHICWMFRLLTPTHPLERPAFCILEGVQIVSSSSPPALLSSPLPRSLLCTLIVVGNSMAVQRQKLRVDFDGGGSQPIQINPAMYPENNGSSVGGKKYAGGESHPGGRGQGRSGEGGRLQVGRGDGPLQGRRRGLPRREDRGGCVGGRASGREVGHRVPAAVSGNTRQCLDSPVRARGLVTPCVAYFPPPPPRGEWVLENVRAAG